MKVTNAQINETNRITRLVGGVYIDFSTKESMSTGTILALEKDGETHYFNVAQIRVEGDNLLVTAKEVGYWAKKFDQIENFDIRSLIGTDLTVITDKAMLAKVNKMSCWC
jgi:co-chaperonin GroES (HSP10)